MYNDANIIICIKLIVNFEKLFIYQSEGGGTVVMFAFGRNEGRGCVASVGVVLLLRRVWPSKLIGIGMYS